MSVTMVMRIMTIDVIAIIVIVIIVVAIITIIGNLDFIIDLLINLTVKLIIYQKLIINLESCFMASRIADFI